GVARLRRQAGAVERGPETQPQAHADMRVQVAELQPARGDHVAPLAQRYPARRLHPQRHAGARPELVPPSGHALDVQEVVHYILRTPSLRARPGEADLECDDVVAQRTVHDASAAQVEPASDGA